MSPESTSQANANTSYLNTLYPTALLEPNKGLNIRGFWNVLVRNKKILVLTTLIALLAALLISLFMQPVYRASATLQIEKPSTTVTDVVVDPTRRTEKDFWQTQIQLLQSRKLASRVMKQLNIEEHFIAQPKFLASLRSNPPTPESTFLKGLSVEPLYNSQLLMVHYEAGDKELAAKIVNGIVDIHIQSLKADKADAANKTKQSLIKQKEQLKETLAQSEAELNNYARQHNIIERSNRISTRTKSLETIEKEIFAEERKRINLEEELEQFDLITQGKQPAFIPKIAEKTKIKKYLADLKPLARDYQQELAKGDTNNTRIPLLEKKIKKQQDKLIKAAKTPQRQLNGRYKIIKQKEESLRKHLAILQKRSIAQQDKVSTYQRLKQEVSTQRTHYQDLSNRINEVSMVGVVDELDSNNPIVVDPAVIPHKKFKPNLKTNLMLGTTMGFLLGLALIFLREFMDNSIKSTEEVEKLTQLPMFGVIPKSKNRESSVIAQQLITEPDSHIAEAIRSLRTSLSFSTETGAPQILCLTSSAAGEGKTSIATNLSISYALAGESVLLIDADLRKPTVAQLLNLKNHIGLSNLLSGQKSQQELILNTSVTNLHVLNAGPLPPDPVELLSRPMMEQLLRKCSERYDRIIIDSPPVLGLADALILSHLADATLLVIHAEKTDKALIKNSLKRLKQAKSHVLGTLMNQMSKMGASYAYRQYGKKYNTEKTSTVVTEQETTQSQPSPTASSKTRNIFKGKMP